ncbi:MAG: type II toxin-antitoxin system Phd/YefM family antitoxin [Eubacterium sp.]|nr:type II toxin-antitoxin system Phd/YefM family antitoxin [Eubacterium sp.]
MSQIIPIKDLENTNAISDKCHMEQEPVFVTKNGRGDLVVMSIETYEKLIDNAQVDLAIAESEDEIAKGGELLDAKEVLMTLRRKHFG